MGTSSNPGRINLKGDSARNEQVESQPITLTSTYTSTKIQSTPQSIRISGAGKGKKGKEVEAIEVALGQFVIPEKTDYSSRICQIRTIDGKKCDKMAVAREENKAPICNLHNLEIMRMRQAASEYGIEFVTAADLLHMQKSK